MKMKIRGLVFTGFAAAVFAQSAMAVTPPSVTYTVPYDTEEEAAVDALKSTVTSKYYTNETFQTRTSVGSNETTDTLKVGRGEGEWAEFKAYQDSNSPNAVGSYLAITAPAAGQARDQYTIDIAAGKVVDSGTGIAGSNGTGPDPTEQHDLTTAKAVYEFVTQQTGNFQREIRETEADALAINKNINGVNGNNAVQIGYRTKTVEGGETSYGPSTWGMLKPAADGANEGYIVFQEDQNKASWDVNINTNKIANDASGVYDAHFGNSGSPTQAMQRKLATTKSVYDYSVPMNWTDRGTEGSFSVANKTLVTDANGVVGLSDTPAIPDFDGSGCNVAGVHCALVSTYTPGEQGAAGTYTLEWTVMAPDDSL